jgi:branched-chain amino acid transport system substrate-binding protein
MTILKQVLIVAIVVLMLGSMLTLAQDEPIVIGASLPLTGTFSIAGAKHGEGYDLCVKLINERGGLLGRPVELIASDNRSDVQEALTQTERFINEDNVDLLFGTFSSRLTTPTSAIAQQNQMVLPIPSGGAVSIYYQGFDYLFYFQQTAAEFTGISVIAALEALIGTDAEGFPTTAAVVHADDFFANALVDGLVGNNVVDDGGNIIVELEPGVIAEAGIELVFQQQWPEEGFSDWIGLAQSIKDSGAEMLFGLTASPTEVIELTLALQTVDYQPTIAYFSQGTQIEYLEGVGDAVNGTIIHSAWHPLANFEGILIDEPFTNEDFIEAYRAEYDGADPDEDVAIPFSLCMGMTQAVQAVGSTDNTAIRDWLASRTEDESVRTILGTYYWDEHGLPINRAHLILQWQDSELKFVYPVGEFEGTVDIIFPKPAW